MPSQKTSATVFIRRRSHYQLSRRVRSRPPASSTHPAPAVLLLRVVRRRRSPLQVPWHLPPRVGPPHSSPCRRRALRSITFLSGPRPVHAGLSLTWRFTTRAAVPTARWALDGR